MPAKQALKRQQLGQVHIQCDTDAAFFKGTFVCKGRSSIGKARCTSNVLHPLHPAELRKALGELRVQWEGLEELWETLSLSLSLYIYIYI